MRDGIKKQAKRMQSRVVIVEDDDELRNAILIPGLIDFGFDAFGVGSAEALYRHILGNPCDLVVLDIGLPNEDGFSVAGHLRDALGMRVGIVMLTGQATGEDQVRGLESGADAFLAKPVEIEVLAATLHSVMRRLGADAGSVVNDRDASEDFSWRLDADGWCICTPTGKSIALTLSERRVLSRLIAHRGQPVERDVLISDLTDDASSFDPHRLEMIVHRLRRKVEERSGEVLPLRTIRGSGYLFSVPN